MVTCCFDKIMTKRNIHVKQIFKKKQQNESKYYKTLHVVIVFSLPQWNHHQWSHYQYLCHCLSPTSIASLVNIFFSKSNFNHLHPFSPVLIWHLYLGNVVQLFYLHMNISLQQLVKKTIWQFFFSHSIWRFFDLILFSFCLLVLDANPPLAVGYVFKGLHFC